MAEEVREALRDLAEGLTNEMLAELTCISRSRG